VSDKREWLVWSMEHGAWWGPNRGGYFTNVCSAGLYTKAEADACVGSRSVCRELAVHISEEADKIRLYHRNVQRLIDALESTEVAS
jgi:hypothetical protein